MCKKREKRQKRRGVTGWAVEAADLPGKDAQQKSLQEPWPTNSVSILKWDVKTTPPSVQSEAALLRPPTPPHQLSPFSASCRNTGSLLVNYVTLFLLTFLHIYITSSCKHTGRWLSSGSCGIKDQIERFELYSSWLITRPATCSWPKTTRRNYVEKVNE